MPLMKEFETLGLSYLDGKLRVLDQRLLPHKEKWHEVESIEHMIELIRQLAVRGAPLIGISAAMALAIFASRGQVQEQALRLRQARPTAVNLMWAIDAMLSVEHTKEALCQKAEELFLLELEMSEKMATFGASVIADNEEIITHCNTGGLATVGIGTALAVIMRAHKLGKKIHVWVDETRPLLQGGRLTTWELAKASIPYTLICDNMAAFLMAQGKISRALVGADRIARNGDFANKIGTYSLAVAAHHHNIPFHVVAPSSTVDKECKSGADIPIEERASSEVQGAQGLIWSPAGCNTYNPSFDVTPNALVTSYILDKGVIKAQELINSCTMPKE